MPGKKAPRIGRGQADAGLRADLALRPTADTFGSRKKRRRCSVGALGRLPQSASVAAPLQHVIVGVRRVRYCDQLTARLDLPLR